MTNPDSLRALTDDVNSFCRARDWDQFHTPKDLAIGVATEAAELLASFRFLSAEEIQELLGSSDGRRAVAHEVGDTLFFLLRLCEKSGIDPAEALREKLALNEARYPVELSRGSNRKYDRL